MADATDWLEADTELTVPPHDATSPSSLAVPALTILTHPERHRIGDRVALPALALEGEVRLSRTEPFFKPPAGSSVGQPLAERSISRRPLHLFVIKPTGAGTPQGALRLDRRSTRTRLTCNGQPVEDVQTLTGADLERGAVLKLGRHVVLLLHSVTLPLPSGVAPHDPRRHRLVGDSPVILRLLQTLDRLAQVETPVLLRGESGTGKELAARALHQGGPRQNGPFVAVNMATLSPSLAAAELFGAIRGAYTGADRTKDGLVQSAQGGTLFLDEIGETPVEVQVMLLRSLESREIVPVGSTTAQPIDVRVLAATDTRLEEAMAAGRFRSALYHRLAGYTVQLPPLRERRDDLGRLLRHFLGETPCSWPSPQIIARLARYDWPGNVRQLRNVARRLTLDGDANLEDLLIPTLSSDAPVTQEPDAAQTPQQKPPPATPSSDTPTPRRLRRRPSEVSETELLATLEAHGYNMRRSAEALDLSRINFYRRLDQSPNLRKAADLERSEIEKALAVVGGDLEGAARALRVSQQGLKRRMTALGLPRL